MKGKSSAGTSLIRATLYGAITALISSNAPTHAAEYEVDGTITQTTFTLTGETRLVEQSEFTVFVRDCNWMIETMEHPKMTFSGKEVEMKIRRQIGTVDGGQEMYEVVRSLHVTPPTDSAVIASNALPIGSNESSVTGHLWLMFASGCHLRPMTSGDYLTPVYDYAASPYVFSSALRKAHWELMDGPGSLPSKVTYTYDDPDRDRGVTYSALSRTNIAGVSIPTAFLFEQPNRSGKSGLRRQAQAIVTAVRPVCSRTSLIPAAEGRVTVLDMRLKHELASGGGEFNYLATNRWLPISEARLIHQKQREHDGAEYHRIATNIFRSVPLVDPYDFSRSTFPNLEMFVRKLCAHADPVSEFVWSALSEPTRQLLLDYSSAGQFKRQSLGTPLVSALAPELKRVMASDSFYTEERFASVTLAADTRQLLSEKPEGDVLRRLNRMLLEDAYPKVIGRSVRTLVDPATGMSALVDYPNRFITFYDAGGGKLSSVDFGAQIQTRERAMAATGGSPDLLPHPGVQNVAFKDDSCSVIVDRNFFRVNVRTGELAWLGAD